MPKVPPRPVSGSAERPRPGEPLPVTSTVWGLERWFTDRAGKRVDITTYDQARAYADANGFKGIHIKFI